MLTQLLKERPEVAEALAALAAPLPTRTLLPNPILLAYPRTNNYAIVGTAFDYLCRWEIERRNPLAHDRPWVATVAVEGVLPSLLVLGKVTQDEAAMFSAIHARARYVHDIFVATRSPTWVDGEFDKSPVPREILEEAVQICLGLAKIDPLFRALKVEKDPHLFPEDDAKDVLAVFDVAPWRYLGGDPRSKPLLNPDFGSVTARFKGADADLVVDDLLIDLKTSKYHDISKHYAQLVGYGMIGDEYRKEDPTYPVIRKAGIYFCRHGDIEVFDYEAVRSNPEYEVTKAVLFNMADELFGPKVADPTDPPGGW